MVCLLLASNRQSKAPAYGVIVCH